MRSTPDAVMLKLSRFLPDQKIPTFSKDTLFNVLCVTVLGFIPTLFILLMCAALFIIRRSTAVRVLSASFWSDASPRHFYSMSGYVQRVSSPTTIHFTPALSQGLLLQDRDALSYSQRLLWQPCITGRITPNMALKDRNNSMSIV